MYHSILKKYLRLSACALVFAAAGLLPVSASEVQPAAQETETETETESEPDARALWYQEHILAMPVRSESKNDQLLSSKLAKMAEADAELRYAYLAGIRSRLAAYLFEEHDVFLSEIYQVHFVCTDEVDYAAVQIGDTEWICQIPSTSFNVHWEVKVRETESETADAAGSEDEEPESAETITVIVYDETENASPAVVTDPWTLASIRSITAGCSQDMDVRYWNGYVPFDVAVPASASEEAAETQPEETASETSVTPVSIVTAASSGLAVDPNTLLHVSLHELALPEGCTDAGTIPVVPYFNQGLGFWDGFAWKNTEWPDVTFSLNGHTMHEAGCGFFTAAMAISYLRQEIVAPIDFMENGQYIGDGAAVTVALESAGQYEVPAVITGSWEEAYAALRAGHLVMENVGPSVFARYGHYILLTGILDDGRIVINDPGNEYHSYWYNWETFDAATCRDARRNDNTSFTIFG